GAYEFKGVYGQYPTNFVPVESAKQKETIRFIVSEMTNCDWMNNREIVQLTGTTTDEITKWQSGVIGNMLGNFILSRIVANQALYAQNAYTLNEYLNDMDVQIWNQTAKSQLTTYDRHIQLAYIDKLCGLVEPLFITSTKSEPRQANETVWASVAAAQLVATRARVAQLASSQPQNARH
ncbi:zinc-dependent metalloprotease, partial [bacterium]|nr:zinc-dependent metalloprotease [bacterium]